MWPICDPACIMKALEDEWHWLLKDHVEWLILCLSRRVVIRIAVKSLSYLWSEYGSMVWLWFECVLTPIHNVVREVTGCEETHHCLGCISGLEEIVGLAMSLTWCWDIGLLCITSIPPIPYFWCLPWSDVAKSNKPLFFITLASLSILS